MEGSKRPSIAIALIGIALIVLLYVVTQSRVTGQGGPRRDLDVAPDSQPTTTSRPAALRVFPFRDDAPQTIACRVLDIVSEHAIAGADVCADKECTQVCSSQPTDEHGQASVVLPDGLSPPCSVFVRTPAALGGGIIEASLPVSPVAELRIPLFARIVVQTSPPFIAESDVAPPALGILWCVTWPEPDDVFAQKPDSETMGRLNNDRIVMEMELLRGGLEYDVRYHNQLNRVEGLDKSKVVRMRRDVRPGSVEIIDLAYSGDVILNYVLPDFDSTKVRVNVTAGRVLKVPIAAIACKELRIIVKNDNGDVVPGAIVKLGFGQEFDASAPSPDGGNVFTPFGSTTSIASRSKLRTSDQNGEVRTRFCNTGKATLFASVSKDGYVVTGFDLWSGVGLPNQTSFTVTVKKASRELSLLTLRGKPLIDSEQILVTLLDNKFKFGQIKYPFMTADGAGYVDLGQLFPGNRYAIIAVSPNGSHTGMFTWTPGMTIDFK